MQIRTAPPSGPFFVTPQQRIELARERYFEQGERPSGLVSEAVIQSWTRCLRARREPAERAAFSPVTASRTHHTLARNRTLLESAQPVLRELEQAIQGSGCCFILTDAQGIVIHASPSSHTNVAVTPLVTRVGVNLGEDEVGTSAPGIVVQTGSACAVHGAEHFFENIKGMYCAAAPIREASGSLAAVLDISIENTELPFDVPALVGMYATGIENRLLIACSRSPILLRLQVNPTLFGTPLEALVAVNEDGHVAWMNTAADRLLMRAELRHAGPPHIEELLGCSFENLLAAAATGNARMHRASNGLGVWVTAKLLAADGISGAMVSLGTPAPTDTTTATASPATPATTDDAALQPAAPQSLQDASRQTIEQALAKANGNVSRAARALGVSRGLLYRRLREWGQAEASGSSAERP